MPEKLGLDSSKTVSDFHFFGTGRSCDMGLISTAFTISKRLFDLDINPDQGGGFGCPRNLVDGFKVECRILERHSSSTNGFLRYIWNLDFAFGHAI